jgi:hypothetical protein
MWNDRDETIRHRRLPSGLGTRPNLALTASCHLLCRPSQCLHRRVPNSTLRSGTYVSDKTESQYSVWLDDRAIEVRSPAEARDFSSNLCVQTGSGAHPASCTMGTGVLSSGVKRCRGVALTTHPHLVPRSWMSRSYTSSPWASDAVCEIALLLQRQLLCQNSCYRYVC